MAGATNASLKLAFSPGFKRLLLAIAALNGLVGINRVVESFVTQDIYRKDFVSGYLMAKAMLNGVSPYIAWLSLRSGKEALCGAMLGAMIALKMAAWPVVIFLALRRIGIWVSLSLAGGALTDTALLFTRQTTPEGVPVVPFAAAALTLIPAAALIGFLWLIWRLDGYHAEKSTETADQTACGAFPVAALNRTGEL